MSKLSHKIFNSVDGRSIELLISLSSGLVSATVVYLEKGEKPTILFSHEKEVSFLHDPSSSELRKHVLKHLDELLSEVVGATEYIYHIDDLYKSHQRIHRITVSLSPLWCATEVVEATQSFDEPTVFTRELLDEILEEDDLTIANKITAVSANGYLVPTEEVLGNQTGDVTVEYLHTTLDEEIRSNISDSIYKHFATDPEVEILYVPFSSVLLTTFAYAHEGEKTFSCIYFDAEDSLWLGMKDNRVVDYRMINYGRAELKRQCIKEGIAPDFIHARSKLSMHLDNHLEKTDAEKINYLLGIEGRVLGDLIADELHAINHPVYVFANEIGNVFITNNVSDSLRSVPTRVFTHDFLADHLQVASDDVEPSLMSMALALYINTDTEL